MSRLKSEVRELRDSNDKLIDDKNHLLANRPALKNQHINKNLENHLENELSKAHTYISGLEQTQGKMQEKFKTKLK